MKILFQGDSITHAHRQPNELNPAFQLGNGYVFLIAAKLSREFPGRPFDFINRGICGNGVNNLLQRWDADALELAPDVLSLLAGVNDTLRAKNGREDECPDDENFSNIYRKLLISLREIKPATQLILLEPFLLTAGRVTSDWQEHLAPRQRAVQEIATEFNAVFVPLQELFDEAARTAPAEYWAWDGIHPTQAGFQLIADALLQAAQSVFFMDQKNAQIPTISSSDIPSNV